MAISTGSKIGSGGEAGKQPSCTLKSKVGAKSLDRNLGDLHTWPYSHYLIQQCNEVGGFPHFFHGVLGGLPRLIQV